MRAFAERHRLRVRRDEAGEPVIPGRDGLIYEYGSGRLAVMVLDLTPRRWGHIRRQCVAGGMEVLQDGDAEGSLIFDPTDDVQALLAIRAAHIRRRRVVSEATRQRLRRMSAERAGRPLEQGFPAAESSRSTSDVSEAA